MKFADFKTVVKDEIEKRVSDKFSVRLNDVVKNNGTKLCGLTIVQEDDNISPVIYIDDYYEAYESGGTTLEDVINGIMELYKRSKAAGSIDMKYFLDYNSVRERIVYKLINTEKNKELLEDIPHFEYLDLSIVFQYLIEDGVIGNATVLIHNSHLKIWGITREELYDDAKRNTPILKEHEIKSMSDVISELMPVQDNTRNAVPLYVLSNKSRLQGAACILYPDLLKNFSTAIGSNLYIIPSSIHEVLLLPTDENDEAENIKQMIKEVNDAEVEADEVLSYSVYYYNLESEKIEIVA